MSIEAKILDGSGSGATASLVKTEGDPTGIVVYSKDLNTFVSTPLFASNPTFGQDMNIDASIGGTPELIHNGTDTVEWTASVLSGDWTFDSTTNPKSGTKCIDATNTIDSNEALFTAPSSIDMSNFSTISGQIRIESFTNPANKHIELRFRLSGGDIGVSINLEEYVDVGLLNVYQGFIIPKEDLEAGTVTIDEIVIKTIDQGPGQPPAYRLDDLQIEETGGGVEFIMQPQKGRFYLATSLQVVMAATLSATVADGTALGLSYDKLLSLTLLTNGILLQRISNKKIVFSANLKDIKDFLSVGFNLTSAISDGTNTFIKMENMFQVPLFLDPSSEDQIKFVISDNLSSILHMRAVLQGKDRAITSS